jgi:hypothetical protein
MGILPMSSFSLPMSRRSKNDQTVKKNLRALRELRGEDK